jgi:hypothetical protein
MSYDSQRKTKGTTQYLLVGSVLHNCVLLSRRNKTTGPHCQGISRKTDYLEANGDSRFSTLFATHLNIRRFTG